MEQAGDRLPAAMEMGMVRDWSLITGRGGYKMGKSQVRNFLRPPLKTG